MADFVIPIATAQVQVIRDLYVKSRIGPFVDYANTPLDLSAVDELSCQYVLPINSGQRRTDIQTSIAGFITFQGFADGTVTLAISGSSFLPGPLPRGAYNAYLQVRNLALDNLQVLAKLYIDMQE